MRFSRSSMLLMAASCAVYSFVVFDPSCSLANLEKSSRRRILSAVIRSLPRLTRFLWYVLICFLRASIERTGFCGSISLRALSSKASARACSGVILDSFSSLVIAASSSAFSLMKALLEAISSSNLAISGSTTGASFGLIGFPASSNSGL